MVTHTNEGIDRYRITTDSHSGILNDPTGWFDDLRDLVATIRRIVHVSVGTVAVINSLPDLLANQSKRLWRIS